MPFLILWVLCGIAAAAIASSRGASGLVWFVAGAVFGPIGLALAFSSGACCPFCRSAIHLKATVCPKCTRELPPVEKTEEAPPHEISGKGLVIILAVVIVGIAALTLAYVLGT